MSETPHSTLTVLVPSYNEEVEVIEKTLISAALQEWPHKHLVLCLDNPVRSVDPADRALLEDTYAMLRRVEARLGQAGSLVANAAGLELPDHAAMARLYDALAAWLHDWADQIPARTAADRFVVAEVVEARAAMYQARARAWARGEHDDARGELDGLAALFDVSVRAFSRKGFANLSQAANKAMNLNSYIFLMGGAYRSVEREGQIWLELCEPGEASLVLPDTDFICTIDADTVILPGYVPRLMEALEGDPRNALAQSPYTGLPAQSAIEHAGTVQTDVRFYLHQGMSALGAAAWVGNNGILRTAALREIRQTLRERDLDFPIFIAERTLIEDAETSNLLAVHGWRSISVGQRLCYTTSPPDFGALVIQRRRWANGGLIIMGDVIRLALKRRWTSRFALELMFRTYYFTNIAASAAAVAVGLLVPFAFWVNPVWALLAFALYLFVVGRDILLTGHTVLDLFKVYALDLLLLPVNIAGVLKSLQQLFTGRRIPFARTPKISTRTAVPFLYILLEYALFTVLALRLGLALWDGAYLAAGIWALNTAAMGYALVFYIGIGAAIEDMRATVGRFIDGLLKPRSSGVVS